jgi:protein TonB
MKTYRITLATCVAFLLLLPACGQQVRNVVEPSPRYEQGARRSDLSDRRTSFASVDDYKFDAAVQIVQFNAAHTFSGKLPAMLPAVVVLRIKVDEWGHIRSAWVQRAPEGDAVASQIALASMDRAGTLPRPLNLADGPDRSLSFSETFLFNSENKFQVRTLAPIQTPD